MVPVWNDAMNTSVKEIIKTLKSHANPENVKGMARFGITTQNALGINLPTLRKMAKEIGEDHLLALDLWNSGIHEAKIMATLIDDPQSVTEKQMDEWVISFNSWDICDQCCSNLFDKTPLAYKKALKWSMRHEEFVKRAGFVLMATLSVHDKKAPDEVFLEFFNFIIQESSDDRNFVKKAINWALRQIGKKNNNLHAKALETIDLLLKSDSKSAQWIAKDALKELKSERVLKKIKIS